MKWQTRFFSLLLALLLLVNLGGSTLAYTASSWAHPEMAEAKNAGIIPDALLQADLTRRLTRQEMCDILVHTFEQMTGIPLYPNRIDHFTDTQDLSVCIAAELGIVNGYPDGTFCPDKTISRQEYAQVVANFYTALGWDDTLLTLGSFPDHALVAAWAKDAAATVIELELIQGNADGTLSPGSNTSREQALTVMLRLYNYLLAYLGLPVAEPVPPSEYSLSCSEWARESMAQVMQYGLMPESLHDADLTQSITRAEICAAAVLTYEAVLQRSATPQAVSHFTDTDDPVINLAYELELIDGFTDGTFRPDDLMVRQQFFQIISNLLYAVGWVDHTTAQTLQAAYTDSDSIADWAKEAAAILVRAGIMHGDTNRQMNPAGLTTREQGIAMFLRAYHYVLAWYAEHPLLQISGPAPVNGDALEVVRYAMQFIGYPYVYGGATPRGFDCSGFVYYVFRQCGYSVSRTTVTQADDGIAVEQEALQPGDIILFYNRAHTEIGHAAIYIGHGRILHAESPETGVCIDDLSGFYLDRYYEARRIVS